MRVGVAHHLGWAIAVTATADHRVVDRRRIELIDPGLPAAPIHHEGGAHAMHRSGPAPSDGELSRLVERVRASAAARAVAGLDELAADVGAISSLSVRDWPTDLPTDIAVLRRPPHEARIDSVMYCQLLAEAATERGWAVHRYDHRTVEAEAQRRGIDLDLRPTLGAPWTKDHRLAFAATVLAG